MFKFIVTDGEDTVELPSQIEYPLSGEEVSRKAQMASGKIVKDVTGYRDVLEISVGYLGVETMALLRNMIRRNYGFLSITYPTPSGAATNNFVVEDPKGKVIKYDDTGHAVWLDVTLKAMTDEVIDE